MFAQSKELTPDMRACTDRLLLCMALLVCLSLVMIFSIKAAQGAATGSAGVGAVLMRLAWVGLGVIAMFLVSRLDLEWIEKRPMYVLGAAFFLLAIVLVPGIGSVRGGARRWIIIAGQGVQPSEFAKLLLIIFMAAYARKHAARLRTFKEGLLWPGIAIAAACGLIFLEPDYGTAILMGSVCLAMLLVAGAAAWQVGLMCAGALPVIGLMVLHSPARLNRVVSFLDPWKYHAGSAYQEIQSLITLGSGGLLGKGLGASYQKYFFLPQSDTDFVFAIIGEELGFIGAAAVVCLFVWMIWTGMKIARSVNDMFSALVAAGVTLLIAMQVVIHVAVVTGSAPTKGITLPFVSMGGSSLVSCMCAVGLLIAVARRASAESGLLSSECAASPKHVANTGPAPLETY